MILAIVKSILSRPFFIYSFLALAIFLGINAFFKIDRKLFPNSNRPQIAVVITQSASSAKDMATNIAIIVEEELYTLENIRKLVIKDVAEAGGYGVIFGEKLSDEEIENLKNVIIKEPRRFITQEVIDFQELEIYDENGNKILRKADFRAYVLTGESTVVWKSGLTRYTTRDDTFIVNSSQGGGFKDTWVLSR